MKVMQVHNRYRLRGGEDAVVDNTLEGLRRHGHDAVLFSKDSDDIPDGLRGKLKATFGAVWSTSARAEMVAALEGEKPDVIHVHNVYPLLSPSVLAAAQSMAIPVVMTCHNYRLSCPIGVHFQGGAICERCRGGHEYWCLIQNCRDNRLESAAYALRNGLSRRFNLFEKNIDKFMCISAFLKDYLVESGLPAEKCCVVPNMIPIPETGIQAGDGQFVAFLGRFSEEKGIETLLEAAALAPEIPVRLGGSGPLEKALRLAAPPNVRFEGMMARDQLAAFYRKARCTVVPSVWYETFGLVAVEAMSHGLPVIASRIGGLAELVADGETGLQFPAGDAAALAEHMRTLWNNPARATAMGQAARQRVMEEYSEDRYIERLVDVYEEVISAAARKAA